jgi:hypothetical protein
MERPTSSWLLGISKKLFGANQNGGVMTSKWNAFAGGRYRLDLQKRILEVRVDLATVQETNRKKGYQVVASMGFPFRQRLQDETGETTSYSGKLIVYREIPISKIEERAIQAAHEILDRNAPPNAKKAARAILAAVHGDLTLLEEIT